MNTRDARTSLNDIPTRVRSFRAWRVGEFEFRLVPNRLGLRQHGRGRTQMCVAALLLLTLSVGAARAEAESCEQRCAQVREEGFSTISDSGDAAVLCCCLSDDSGQSVSEPLEQCEKIR